jgi:predicted CXXCH cytochrome family protein
MRNVETSKRRKVETIVNCQLSIADCRLPIAGVVVVAAIGAMLVRAASPGQESDETSTLSYIEQATPAAGEIERQDVVASRIASAARGVAGSKHDFSLLTGRPADLCTACHVPHVQTAQAQPDQEESFALAFYRVGGQREVLVPDRYMPGPTSLICLSCHNGTVAASTVASSHVLLAGRREGFDAADGFATRDHPIGVEYPAHAKGYRSRSEVAGAGKIVLPEGRIECISCHDPHNQSGVEKMLVQSNRRSALCLACHVK